MKPGWRRWLTALPAAALLAGCVSVDYTGQSFDPTPEDVPIDYFRSRREIPAGRYRIIGRGVISTTRRIDGYDIRELLTVAAREHGADAVALVSEKQVRIGVYEGSGDLISGPSSSSANVYSMNPDGSPVQVDSFGAQTSLQGEVHYRTELEVRALFLKDREALEQLLARRGRELDALVKQNDPGVHSGAEPEETTGAPAGKTAPEPAAEPEKTTGGDKTENAASK